MEDITSYARARFTTALLILAAGVILGVGAFVFSAGLERWVLLGVGVGALLITLTAFAMTGRGSVQRVLDAALVLFSIWTLASSRTLAQIAHGQDTALVRWLGASAGAAIALLGLISLVAHEFGLERDLTYATERIWGLTAPHQDQRELDEYPQTIPR